MLLLMWSISSSLHFWEYAFKDPIYSYGAVVVLDGLALLGFGLHLARINSPLTNVRHTLPLVSALPLVFDMHRQFQHLGDGMLTWAFTIGVTGLLVALSFVVWRTIERLFVDPVQAAREYAEHRMQALVTTSEQLQVMQRVADGFVHDHQHRTLAPMQSYARLAEPMQPAVHVANDSTPNQFECAKCGAMNDVPAGKDGLALRKSSGRWGCSQCKTG
jgi:hypothetical protein